MTWKIYSLRAYKVPSLAIFKQRGQKISANSICTRTSSFILPFDHVNWTSLGAIYMLGASTVSSLGTFQQRVKRYQVDIFLKNQQCDLVLCPCDLKINRGPLLPRDIHYAKFGNFQAKGSKDIKQTTFFSKTSCVILTFDHLTWKQWGHLPHQVWQLSNKGVKSYWVDIAWSTDRLSGAKQYVLFFSKRGHIKLYFNAKFKSLNRDIY